ncbi:hypothetical protein PISMIDRAFT_120481 [Pisolithus microcarpus 441]|uniref:Uncharacterized protein n=1 Tax=Pisolithus microcarpus 441 TaxID=765257 RepID=A0A0C9YXK2_9AGAM|nr:hypothetical protein PISMIDRAFT_120481 [Pisolithus microcarpus 441]
MQSYCDVAILQQFGATSRRYSQLVRGYLQSRVVSVGAQYFTEGKILIDILRTCDAVISGSTALHVMLPEHGTAWSPQDLDIYVTQACTERLLRKVLFEGYTIVKDANLNEMGYTYPKVSHLFVFTKGHRRIDVIVSSTSTAISPILQFHSTAVMNFISADTIFCCYPSLTLRQLSMMNAAFLYFGATTAAVLEAVAKYKSRGFHFVRCKDVHDRKNLCKVRTRTLTDGATMWINMLDIPEASHTCDDLFRQLGVLDVQWMLGGMPCDLECAFCRPRVEVVKDES